MLPIDVYTLVVGIVDVHCEQYEDGTLVVSVFVVTFVSVVGLTPVDVVSVIWISFMNFLSNRSDAVVTERGLNVLSLTTTTEMVEPMTCEVLLLV